MDGLSFLRFIELNGSKYVRVDDVAAFINELAATEETDTRNRLQQAARNLLKPKPIANEDWFKTK